MKVGIALLCLVSVAHAAPTQILVLSQPSLSRPELARGLASLRKRLSSLRPTMRTEEAAELGPATIALAVAGMPEGRRILILIGPDRAVDCKPPTGVSIYAISVGGRLPHGGCFSSLGAVTHMPLDAEATSRALDEIATEILRER